MELIQPFLPVIVAAVLVFVADLIGNVLAFGNRVVNALVTAIIFGVVLAAFSYFEVDILTVDSTLKTVIG